jgi:hypothetical protein
MALCAAEDINGARDLDGHRQRPPLALVSSTMRSAKVSKASAIA